MKKLGVINSKMNWYVWTVLKLMNRRISRRTKFLPKARREKKIIIFVTDAKSDFNFVEGGPSGRRDGEDPGPRPSLKIIPAGRGDGQDRGVEGTQNKDS